MKESETRFYRRDMSDLAVRCKMPSVL